MQQITVPIVNIKRRWNVGVHGKYVKDKLWSMTVKELAKDMGVTVPSLSGFMRATGIKKKDYGGKKNMYPILCENPECGNVFRTRRKTRRYCGRSCAMKHYIAVNGQPKREYKRKAA